MALMTCPECTDQDRHRAWAFSDIGPKTPDRPLPLNNLRLFTTAAVAAVVIVLVSGCIPEEVVWLPDSSGFVYTTGQDVSTINYYSMSGKTWRVIVADTKCRTPWPAVSPDGKHVATARALTENNRQTIQVFIWDMEGREVHCSEITDWGENKSPRDGSKLDETALAWSPRYDRLLVATNAGWGYYDPTRGTFKTMAEMGRTLCPFPHPRVFRPDNKGLLVVTQENNSRTPMLFLRWDGTRTEFEWTDQFREQFKKRSLDIRWADTVVVVTQEGGSMHLDTESGKIQWQARTQSVGGLTGASACCMFVGDKALLRCREIGDPLNVDAGKDVVELVYPETGQTFVKADDLKYGTTRIASSPDRRFAVLNGEMRSGKHVLGVIDAAGKLLLDIDRRHPMSASVPPPLPEREPLPKSYVALATHLTDTLTRRGEFEEQKDFTQFLADANAALVDIRGIDTNDGQLQFIAKEAGEAIGQLLGSQKEVATLPKPPSAGQEFADSFVLGMLGQIDEGIKLNKENRGKAEAILAEARKSSLAYQRINAAKLLLPRIAAKHAGPKVQSGQAIYSAWWCRWGPFNRFNLLHLGNLVGGGRTLHNCTVLVELRNGADEVARNVHFLPEWRADTVYAARYRPGFDFGTGDMVCRQTVNDVGVIKTSLWCDELTQENVITLFTESRKDELIREYCSNLKLTTVFQPFKEGFFGRNRGVVATMTGLPFLPPCRVEVTFSRNGQTQTIHWEVDSWKNGQTKAFADKRFEWDPTSIVVRVSFHDTNYYYESLELK